MDLQDSFLLTLHFWIYMSIGFCMLPPVISQIPLGSKISPADDNLWVSSNGDFALGFFNSSNQPYQYSVGIRFHSNSIADDKRTVVWVAGANVVVGDNSYFEITERGELLVFDSSKGVVAWNSNTSQLSVSSAVLHDNGNLVLLDQSKATAWQSFDFPSNTLLPGQKLKVLHSLRAAAVDSLASYYSLYMNASGELQLRWDSDVVFWTGGSNTNSNTTSAVLAVDGALHLIDREEEEEPIWSLYGEDHGDNVSYRFLRLDIDGNLRMYSWEQSVLSWRSVWQAVENQCHVFATCGQRGICGLNVSGSTQCSCPFGLVNNPKSNSHCLVPYQQGCRSGSVMLQYEETFLHAMYPPNHFTIQEAISVEQCKIVCQRDSLCTAATFKNDGTAQCLLTTTRYLTGYSDSSSGRGAVSFVKKCLDPVAVDPSIPRSSPSPPTASSVKHLSTNDDGFCIPCLVGAAAGTFVVFVAIQVLVGLYVYKKQGKSIWIKSSSMAASCKNNPKYSKGLIMLSFAEIKEVTGDFKHQIGPNMYKGMFSDKRAVAVKDLLESTTVDERRFRTTVSKIGSIHHRNLIKLEGYCFESVHRYLVYEYAKHGSLDKYIEDPEMSKRLTWRKRVEICLSVAKALCYLHSECREFVVHGNLKCSNIVLDEYLEARVTEFGLVRARRESSSRDMSAEKDVDDFGRVVMELVSGCCPGSKDSLVEAYGQLKEGRAGDVVDKRVVTQEVDWEEVERVIRIAFWCVQSNERLRPSMGEVMKVLEGTLVVDPPPPPFPLPHGDNANSNAHVNVNDDEDSSESSSGT